MWDCSLFLRPHLREDWWVYTVLFLVSRPIWDWVCKLCEPPAMGTNHPFDLMNYEKSRFSFCEYAGISKKQINIPEGIIIYTLRSQFIGRQITHINYCHSQQISKNKCALLCSPCSLGRLLWFSSRGTAFRSIFSNSTIFAMSSSSPKETKSLMIPHRWIGMRHERKGEWKRSTKWETADSPRSSCRWGTLRRPSPRMGALSGYSFLQSVA